MAEMVLQGLFIKIFDRKCGCFDYQIILHFNFLDQVGLKGEALNLHSLSGSSSVEWVEGSLVTQRQPLTWFKVHN